MRLLVSLIAAVFLVSQAFPSHNVNLLAAGASFPAPLIMAMADEYRDLTDGAVTINYQSIGSSSGVRQFLTETVALAATEAFLSDAQLADFPAGNRVFHLPLVVGDVVVAYNVPGVPSGLVLDGVVLAGIYAGEITHWNDPRIAALNDGVVLPDLGITVVHRSDGSGSTNIFTSFLAEASAAWRTDVGVGTAVDWPTGLGAQGNEGVAGVVQNTPGAIGYTSLAYARLSDMDYASLVNAAGNVIPPSFAATSAAAAVDLPDDNRVMIANTPAADGYPLAGFSWFIVHEQLDATRAISSQDEAVALVEFLLWAVTDGQAFAETLHFAPIPPPVQEANIALLAELTWNGEPIGADVVQSSLF